jgi:hypothetical protein
MRRRTLLSAAAGTVAALAGCSSGAGTGPHTQPTDEDSGADAVVNVEPLPVTPDDAVTELSVRWNRTTTFVLDPDEAGVRHANEHYRFLVVQLAVANTGDAIATVTPPMFQVASTEKDLFPRVHVADPDTFRTRRLAPGDEAVGWLAFQVRRGITKYLFAVSNDALPEPVAVVFDYDEDMPMRYRDDETGSTVPGETVTTREPTASPTPTVPGDG